MWTSFVNLFLNLLLFIYKIVGNFGVAIIIFTILIKLLTHPLMKAQIKSSKLMAELNTDPEYLEMQEKYKNDKERLAQEQMKIYKKKGINLHSASDHLRTLSGRHRSDRFHPDGYAGTDQACDPQLDQDI